MNELTQARYKAEKRGSQVGTIAHFLIVQILMLDQVDDFIEDLALNRIEPTDFLRQIIFFKVPKNKY